METDTNQTCQNSPTVPPADVGQVTVTVSPQNEKILSPVIDGETGKALHEPRFGANPLSDLSMPIKSIRWAIRDVRAATVHQGIDYLDTQRRKIQDADERRAYSKAIMDLQDFHIMVMRGDVL